VEQRLLRKYIVVELDHLAQGIGVQRRVLVASPLVEHARQEYGQQLGVFGQIGLTLEWFDVVVIT